jgi:hypothetical protein
VGREALEQQSFVNRFKSYFCLKGFVGTSTRILLRCGGRGQDTPYAYTMFQKQVNHIINSY